jgi:hypothetical protein
MKNTKSKEVRVQRLARAEVVNPLTRTTMSRDEAEAYMSRGGDITRLDQMIQLDTQRHTNQIDQYDYVEFTFIGADGAFYDPADQAEEDMEDA